MNINNQIKLLIVDDTEENRFFLAKSLTRKGYFVETKDSGESAVEHVNMFPEKYDFIFIDHIMGDRISFTGKPRKLDGFETCEKILGYTNKAIVVIYSHSPTNDEEKLYQYVRAAYKNGAVRYMIREWEQDKQIDHFITQIKQLQPIKYQLCKYHDIQKEMPSLIREMKVGTILFDVEGKIWHISPMMSNILNITQDDLKKHFEDVLSPVYKSCKNQKKQIHEEIYLFQTDAFEQDLRYLIVKSQIIYHEKVTVAYNLTFSDITGSTIHKRMDVNHRYQMIVRSMCERKDGFDHAFIYIYENYKIVLKACTRNPNIYVDRSYFLSEMHYLPKTIEKFKKCGKGIFYPEHSETKLYPEHIKGPFIQWPIMEGKHLIGFAVASGKTQKKCNPDMIPIMQPYINEIKNISDSKKDWVQQATIDRTMSDKDWVQQASVDRTMTFIELELSHTQTCISALRFLIDKVAQETDSLTVHIRYLQGDKAVLFKDHSVGDYPQVAEYKVDISKRDTLAGRVLFTGNEFFADDIVTTESLRYFKNKDRKPAQVKLLSKIKSLYYIPLIFVGEVIGLLALHSDKINHYSEYRRNIAKHISNKIAVALHDYLVREREMQNEWFLMLIHDLRTPVGLLSRFSKHLSNTELSEKQKQLSSLISQNSYRFDRMITKLMSLTLIDNDKKMFSKKNVVLHNIVIEVIEMMIMYAEEFGITIEYKDLTPQDKEEIYADKDALTEVFTNLLDNAIKYTKAIGKKIEVSIEAINDNHVICIRDSGRGIPEHLHQCIFEKFNRGDAEHDEVSGTGIGLFVTKYIVEKGHNGKITVESTPNQGSLFKIIFPYFNTKKE